MAEVRSWTLIDAPIGDGIGLAKNTYLAQPEPASEEQKRLWPNSFIEVIAKADLQPIVDKMRAYYEDGSESGPQVIREFLEAWEGSNGTK